MRHRAYPVFPELHTPDLLLRELSADDLEGTLDLTFYDGQPATSLPMAQRMLEVMARDYRLGNGIHWGVVLKATNTIVGTCGFYRGFAHGGGEIGYVLRDAYRGRGIMAQAVQAIITFGWHELHLRQITAYCEPDNHASQALLRKLHFAPFGTTDDGLLAFRLLPPAPC
ncbi:GNAT family N-acetyltransferase [Hymenobacter busanensis]|nr:GNAT family N-acetyltransferase [Hymenobacter busanensis]QHJ08058.1 GNAT family N-acetyltransferase [Hymenobacter busanensis]